MIRLILILRPPSSAYIFFTSVHRAGDSGGISSNGTINVDYAFQCKKNAEATFAPCVCNVPPVGSWEMCQQYSGLDRAGLMSFVVRAVKLTYDISSSTYVIATPLQATATASYSWTVDTVKPVAFIGTYYDPLTGSVVGTAPPPCASGIATSTMVFEISMNEPNGTLQCRLSNWIEA